jgi:ABC-2 type transport system ATP-binding protein
MPFDSAQPVIELSRLTVRFGTRPILKGLDARLYGTSIGLLGPNGAGKSTLIHTLLGMCPVAEGTAKVMGHDIRKEQRRIRSFVGYMPEGDAVAMVRMMGELSGLPPEAALERAHEVLFYVGLGEARYRRLGTFSQGMRQLAKLAQAVVHGPRLLILDEPTNGLDPAARTRMIRLIQQIRSSGKVHILLCSHLLADVEQICQEVVILKDGWLIADVDLDAQRRCDRRFLDVEVWDGADQFAGAMAGLGCTCSSSGQGRISMILPEGLHLQQGYPTIVDLDVPIRRLSYRTDSLEQIFLRAMESADGGL